ncbi:MAG TPA: hypothetical protein VKT81_15755 [Bryobacteraceae bacterium]|nr:hypothetical protein [Bryobacteraceae bacterium]
MRKVSFAVFGIVLTANAAEFKLDSAAGLDLINAKAEAVNYRGRRAVRLDPIPGQENIGSMLALLPGSNFKNGTIQVDLAGSPRAGSPPTSRGFIGVAFRVQPQAAKFECFYVRPTNARADDQLRRNHTAQYISVPDFPWERLRKEAPGVYESYADMEPGAWTTLKIVVSGSKAQLYVNNAKEPCLIVNDLKLGELEGRIALWADSTTDGYFSNLKID